MTQVVHVKLAGMLNTAVEEPLEDELLELMTWDWLRDRRPNFLKRAWPLVLVVADPIFWRKDPMSAIMEAMLLSEMLVRRAALPK